MVIETPRIVMVATRASNQPVVQAIVRAKVLAIVPAAAAPEHAQVVAEQVLQVGEPETAQVVAGPERVPVVAELERDRAAAELRPVLVVAAPQDRPRNRRHGPAERAAPTKWGIAAYQPVPVMVRMGGAVLAAEAAALLARAVAAAVTAWAVAASAEAAVAAAVVMAAAAGEAAAAEAGDSGLS
jgi:hypothetical protein